MSRNKFQPRPQYLINTTDLKESQEIQNKKLIDEHGLIKKEMKRGVHYEYVDHETWLKYKKNCDLEVLRYEIEKRNKVVIDEFPVRVIFYLVSNEDNSNNEKNHVKENKNNFEKNLNKEKKNNNEKNNDKNNNLYEKNYNEEKFNNEKNNNHNSNNNFDYSNDSDLNYYNENNKIYMYKDFIQIDQKYYNFDQLSNYIKKNKIKTIKSLLISKKENIFDYIKILFFDVNLELEYFKKNYYVELSSGNVIDPLSKLKNLKSKVLHFFIKRIKNNAKIEALGGLSNLGNTCFMNSSLQCLLNLNELNLYFNNEKYKNDGLILKKKTKHENNAQNEVFKYYNHKNKEDDNYKKYLQKFNDENHDKQKILNKKENYYKSCGNFSMINLNYTDKKNLKSDEKTNNSPFHYFYRQKHVSKKYAELINDLSANNLHCPVDFRRTLVRKLHKFDNYQEHDAAEFLESFLDVLHEELKNDFSKKEILNKNVQFNNEKNISFNNNDSKNFEFHVIGNDIQNKKLIEVDTILDDKLKNNNEKNNKLMNNDIKDYYLNQNHIAKHEKDSNKEENKIEEIKEENNKEINNKEEKNNDVNKEENKNEENKLEENKKEKILEINYDTNLKNINKESINLPNEKDFNSLNLIFDIDKSEKNLISQTKDFYKIFFEGFTQKFINGNDLLEKENRKAMKNFYNYTKHNNSFISKYFFGQFQSSLECLNCRKVSHTYDPFILLTLPIPNQKMYHPFIILTLKNKPPFKINIENNLTVKELKFKIIEEYKITNVMCITILKDNRKVLEDFSVIDCFKNIFCYEFDTEKKYFWIILKRKAKFKFFDSNLNYQILCENVKSKEELKLKIERIIEMFEIERNFNTLHTDNNKNLNNSNEMKDVNLREKNKGKSIDDTNKEIEEKEIFKDNLKKTKELYKNSNKSTSSIFSLFSNDSNEFDSIITDLFEVKNCDKIINGQSDCKVYILDNIYDNLFGKKFDIETYLQIKNKNTNLYDCLNLFMKKEILIDENKVSCKKCKMKTNHSKRLQLNLLPMYLIIQLKRFSYNNGYSEKIKDFVDFPEILKIENLNYKLISVCNHIEFSISCGHYTAYVKKDKWFLCNDSSVIETNLNKENAYILFYQRI